MKTLLQSINDMFQCVPNTTAVLVLVQTGPKSIIHMHNKRIRYELFIQLKTCLYMNLENFSMKRLTEMLVGLWKSPDILFFLIIHLQ